MDIREKGRQFLYRNEFYLTVLVPLDPAVEV